MCDKCDFNFDLPNFVVKMCASHEIKTFEFTPSYWGWLGWYHGETVNLQPKIEKDVQIFEYDLLPWLDKNKLDQYRIYFTIKVNGLKIERSGSLKDSVWIKMEEPTSTKLADSLVEIKESVNDVETWLRENKYDKYIATFADHKITELKQLGKLGVADLIELGVSDCTTVRQMMNSFLLLSFPSESADKIKNPVDEQTIIITDEKKVEHKFSISRASLKKLLGIYYETLMCDKDIYNVPSHISKDPNIFGIVSNMIKSEGELTSSTVYDIYKLCRSIHFKSGENRIANWINKCDGVELWCDNLFKILHESHNKSIQEAAISRFLKSPTEVQNSLLERLLGNKFLKLIIKTIYQKIALLSKEQRNAIPKYTYVAPLIDSKSSDEMKISFDKSEKNDFCILAKETNTDRREWYISKSLLKSKSKFFDELLSIKVDLSKFELSNFHSKNEIEVLLRIIHGDSIKFSDITCHSSLQGTYSLCKEWKIDLGIQACHDYIFSQKNGYHGIWGVWYILEYFDDPIVYDHLIKSFKAKHYRDYLVEHVNHMGSSLDQGNIHKFVQEMCTILLSEYRIGSNV